jgi:hypothetical protein
MRAQAIRSQLDTWGICTAINPLTIKNEESEEKEDNLKFAWILSFKHLKLSDVPCRLDLPAQEGTDRSGATFIDITVENLLTPAQLEILVKLPGQRAHTAYIPNRSKAKAVVKRKSRKTQTKKTQSKTIVRIPTPTVPDVTIEWPCGASWSSSKKEQHVIPIRADLSMIFIILCGKKEDFADKIYHLFHMLVQNGAAIVPAKKASGIVSVPDTDVINSRHGCQWKLKHLGANQWRVGITTEVQLGSGSAQLFIANKVYQKNKPKRVKVLDLPSFSP